MFIFFLLSVLRRRCAECSECSSVIQSAGECIRVLQSAPACFKILQSALKCSQVLQRACFRLLQDQGASGYSRILWSCSRILQSAPGCSTMFRSSPESSTFLLTTFFGIKLIQNQIVTSTTTNVCPKPMNPNFQGVCFGLCIYYSTNEDLPALSHTTYAAAQQTLSLVIM